MFRRPLSVVFSFALLTSALLAADRPNVVIVITDDQGYGDLSCHGNPVLKTPEIDKLYADSVRLKDYHVSPTCSPTRSAFLTQPYLHNLGPYLQTKVGVRMVAEEGLVLCGSCACSLPV